jgi:hypothetical protein
MTSRTSVADLVLKLAGGSITNAKAPDESHRFRLQDAGTFDWMATAAASQQRHRGEACREQTQARRAVAIQSHQIVRLAQLTSRGLIEIG